MNNSTNPSQFQDEFRAFLERTSRGGDLSAEVANEALTWEDPIDFIDHLLNYGCIC